MPAARWLKLQSKLTKELAMLAKNFAVRKSLDGPCGNAVSWLGGWVSHPRLPLCYAKISDDKLFFGSRDRRILPPTPRPIRSISLSFASRW